MSNSKTRHEAMMEETGEKPTDLMQTNRLEFIKLFHRNFNEADWRRWASVTGKSVEELKRALGVSEAKQ